MDKIRESKVLREAKSHLAVTGQVCCDTDMGLEEHGRGAGGSGSLAQHHPAERASRPVRQESLPPFHRGGHLGQRMHDLPQAFVSTGRTWGCSPCPAAFGRRLGPDPVHPDPHPSAPLKGRTPFLGLLGLPTWPGHSAHGSPGGGRGNSIAGDGWRLRFHSGLHTPRLESWWLDPRKRSGGLCGAPG